MNHDHSIKTITSAHNPTYRSLRDCLTSKGIKKHGRFLMSGERAITDTLARAAEGALSLLINANDESHPELARKIRIHAASLRVTGLTEELFEALDVFGTHFPLLVLQAPDLPRADLHVPPHGLEVLCALGDPSNVGALIRSAAGFGATRVVLLQESALPFHPRAVRAASATTLLCPLARGPSIHELAQLPTAKSIACLDMHGESIESFAWPEHVRVLVGEEGQGIPNATAFQTIGIPMAPGVESLNATVASSIALYS